MADEIERCPACGTPKLDNAPKALVLYFVTDADRVEFIEAFKEAKPNVRTVALD